MVVIHLTPVFTRGLNRWIFPGNILNKHKYKKYPAICGWFSEDQWWHLHTTDSYLRSQKEQELPGSHLALTFTLMETQTNHKSGIFPAIHQGVSAAGRTGSITGISNPNFPLVLVLSFGGREGLAAPEMLNKELRLRAVSSGTFTQAAILLTHCLNHLSNSQGGWELSFLRRPSKHRFITAECQGS